jgi:hypothetical protein
MLASLAAAAASAGVRVPAQPVASPPLSAAQSSIDAQQPTLADPYTSSFPPPSTMNIQPKLPKEAVVVGLDSNRLGRWVCGSWDDV